MEDRIRLANFLRRALAREWVKYDRFVHVVEPGGRTFKVDALGLALVGAHLKLGTAIESCMFVRQAAQCDETAAIFLNVSPPAVARLREIEREEALIENIPHLLRGEERPKRPLTDYYAGRRP